MNESLFENVLNSNQTHTQMDKIRLEKLRNDPDFLETPDCLSLFANQLRCILRGQKEILYIGQKEKYSERVLRLLWASALKASLRRENSALDVIFKCWFFFNKQKTFKIEFLLFLLWLLVINQ